MVKIILDDFWYKGRHFDHYECELPHVDNVDGVTDEQITEYIAKSLDSF